MVESWVKIKKLGEKNAAAVYDEYGVFKGVLDATGGTHVRETSIIQFCSCDLDTATARSTLFYDVQAIKADQTSREFRRRLVKVPLLRRILRKILLRRQIRKLIRLKKAEQ